MAEAEGFICPVCLAAYGSVDKLQNHWESAHSDGLGYACPCLRSDVLVLLTLSGTFRLQRSDIGQCAHVPINTVELTVSTVQQGRCLLSPFCSGATRLNQHRSFTFFSLLKFPKTCLVIYFMTASIVWHRSVCALCRTIFQVQRLQYGGVRQMRGWCPATTGTT